MSKIYYESLSEAIERNKPEIASIKKSLEDAGVKTVRSLADIGDALKEITGW